MKSLWSDVDAAPFREDPLGMRVYTSNLIGRDEDLVVHGGGNTSVKVRQENFFGEAEELLLVKGSGWDLATIERQGFAPVKMDVLLKLAEFDTLSDTDMVREQRKAMTDPSAPSPSVEAILHALIPHRFVDHTHADAVVAVTNAGLSEEALREIFGERMLFVPYVMPGFVLAKAVRDLTRGLDWGTLDGMVLLNHGIFTFDSDARVSYERMIEYVSRAEEYLEAGGALAAPAQAEVRESTDEERLALARLRCAVGHARGRPVLARLDNGADAAGFAARSDAAGLGTRGPLTPDHIIRTKRVPLVVTDDPEGDVGVYGDSYTEYFAANDPGGLERLDPAPRWAVWPGVGTVSFGDNARGVGIVADIVRHTVRAVQWAEHVGSWSPLPASELFEVEYWELEQAKLKKAGSPPEFQGKVALVTGAASGIGRACAEALRAAGAAIVALDLNSEVESLFSGDDALGVACDVRDEDAVSGAIARAVEKFGGLDILVSNAGVFPKTRTLADMDGGFWDRAIGLNLTSHQMVLRCAIPFLERGFDSAVVFIGSKNVPAPGPGMAAYSVPKAGLTQLARVAALELAPSGIRVNVLHPDAVFDTGVWTEEVLESRAAKYGMSVAEYKTRNLLSTEVASDDVAAAALALAGSTFSKTTGAQIPIDGGNDRVI